VLGTVVFSCCFEYLSMEQWEADRSKHLVEQSSPYDFNLLDGGEHRRSFGWVVGATTSSTALSVPKMHRSYRSLFQVVRS